MSTPGWALTLAYWLHMLATVVWIGGLAALSILVLPAARKTLGETAYTDFLTDLQRRLDPLAWFSLAVLVGTGLFQMSASPNYNGFLAIGNRWAVAILLKHILIFGMAGLSAYITWGLLPGLRRIAMQHAISKQDGGLHAADGAELSRRELRLLRINLLLGVLVLALTAVARAS
jgi:uncharacterized membrane protein